MHNKECGAALTWVAGLGESGDVADRAGEFFRFGNGWEDAEGATAPESLRHNGPRGSTAMLWKVFFPKGLSRRRG